MFLKLDMEKAFDKMEWPFILSIMKKLGFHSIWISWIETCISSSHFSILINESSFGNFSPGRGLRQRDPLSPFLFILGSEVLSRLLQREETLGNIKGMKIARSNPAIHHLLFADDLLLFGKATISEACSFKLCLDKYCLWLGQTINASKSSIRFSKNSNPTTTSNILSIFPYKVNPQSSTYLGLPIMIGKSKKAAFQGIMDKVNSKIEGWKAKSLSQVGRLVLIKAVSAAIPSYAMSTFMLLASFCQKLDQSFKNFWWGFPSKKTRNLTLKSWGSLCIPKSLGGLGFRKMRDVNLALVSKLGWKLRSKSDSMWVTKLSGKYLNSGSFLSPTPLSSASWLWKGILHFRSIISQGACHKVHPQSSLPIWTSLWIPSLPSFSPSPALNSSSLSNLVVSDLITPAASWNLPLLTSLFDSSSVCEIQKTQIHPSPTIDIWIPTANGVFSTKSAYKLIRSLRPPRLSSPFDPKQWSLLWKIKLNARLKLLLWKIAWDILPTKSRLNSIFPISAAASFCPLCKSEEDSLHHLFFRCCFARIAWRLSF
jgi:hypothetical protein